MNRTYNDLQLSLADREALYRRQARLTRERDRFPFSTFNARTYASRRRFDAYLDARG